MGMGRLHMRERAELCGGHCVTLPRSPQGTEVRCEWPLNAVLSEVTEQGED
jgi:signal transduction histidine kinase